jgi:hypothetical protein
MKRLVLNDRGFTLIEALITTALFIIMVMAVQSLTLDLARDGLKVSKKARMQKIARTVMYQLVTSSERFPGVPRDARFDSPVFQPFDDNTVSDQLCYNDDGGQTTVGATDCTVYVSSYKVQMVSKEYAAGSDLRLLPLYRLNVRFKFKDNGADRSIVLTQFLTPSLRQ